MALAVALAAGTALSATVESRAQGQSQPSDAQLLEDFNFYVLTANLELAKANAQALIDRGLTPQQFVALIEDSATLPERFDRASTRALLIPELEGLSAQLRSLYEKGQLERARDPREIEKNIELLKGTPRAQVLGRNRLAKAGEYAVPQLLQVLMARNDNVLHAEVGALLVMMGRQAVGPLSAALLKVDPATQETLARVLGRINYASAAPFLTELHRTTTLEPVRAAAKNALEQMGASTSPDTSVAGLYRELAEQYYDEPKALTSFQGEAYQLLWDFDPRSGLNPTAIATEVYHEAMAMRLAEKALALDPSEQGSIALWLAANFSRELDQKAEYENPAYPVGTPSTGGRRDAMYYAVAAGAQTTQQVLARALADFDTPLARKAIESLSRSAGVSGLVGDSGVPLVDALSYPERRVRWEAAIALGRAKPRVPFAGGERVVPTLAGVVREAEKRYAVVLATELNRQQELRALVSGLGYEVLPPQGGLESANQSISEVPGIDLIVTDLPTETSIDTIAQIRRTTRLQATPLLAFVSASGMTQYSGQFEGDRLTRLARPGITDEQAGQALTDLVRTATGEPITAEEAKQYAAESLSVLQELAIASAGAGTAASAFDIADAASPLMTALNDTTGPLRIQVSDVLSYIPQNRVQVALMDAVMNASGDERLVLMTKVNASAKRFGNLLDDRQVRWLVETAEKGSEDEATLAASLMGALNLPNAKIVPLIVGGK